MTSPTQHFEQRHPNGGTMKFFANFIERLYIFRELWLFMKVRKRWWLGPLLFVLLLLGFLIILTEGSAIAPFIYTLF